MTERKNVEICRDSCGDLGYSTIRRLDEAASMAIITDANLSLKQTGGCVLDSLQHRASGMVQLVNCKVVIL
jgi:hypothetical protein